MPKINEPRVVKKNGRTTGESTDILPVNSGKHITKRVVTIKEIKSNKVPAILELKRSFWLSTL
jgi:hypothetical protein